MSRFDNWKLPTTAEETPHNALGDALQRQIGGSEGSPDTGFANRTSTGLEAFEKTNAGCMGEALLRDITGLATGVRQEIGSTTGNVVPDFKGPIAEAVLRG